MLVLLPEQLARLEAEAQRRFCQGVWAIWAETEGPRFPALHEAEGFDRIARVARFCSESAYDDPVSVTRAALHALLAEQTGRDAAFVRDMLVFLVNRELPADEAFVWIEHVLEERPDER